MGGGGLSSRHSPVGDTISHCWLLLLLGRTLHVCPLAPCRPHSWRDSLAPTPRPLLVTHLPSMTLTKLWLAAIQRNASFALQPRTPGLGTGLQPWPAITGAPSAVLHDGICIFMVSCHRLVLFVLGRGRFGRSGPANERNGRPWNLCVPGSIAKPTHWVGSLYILGKRKSARHHHSHGSP